MTKQNTKATSTAVLVMCGVVAVVCAVITRDQVVLSRSASWLGFVPALAGIWFFRVWKASFASAHISGKLTLFVITLFGAVLPVAAATMLLRITCMTSSSTHSTIHGTVVSVYDPQKPSLCNLYYTVQLSGQDQDRFCVAHVPHPAAAIGDSVSVSISKGALGYVVRSVSMAKAQQGAQPDVHAFGAAAG